MILERSDPPAERGRRDFVNRERELLELRLALDSAIDGHGSLSVVSGEVGIGKTRLVSELAAEASTRGAPVLWGRCWEGGGSPALWPWTQLVRAYVRGHDAGSLRQALGPAAAQIAPIIPEIGATPVAADLASEHGRFYFFDAMTSLFKQAAAARGLLIILDDLHAADTLSLLLLRFLCKELHEMRLLVVGTYRDAEARRGSEVSELLLEIGREARLLPLRGLAEHQVGQLIAERADVVPRPAEVKSLHQLTEGNPLFVDEILRSRVAGDLLEHGIRELPYGVRELIRRRFVNLAAMDQEVLSIAAVAGREFAVAVLKGVCGRPLDQILEILDRAADEGIIERGVASRGVHRFSQALYREVLYDDLPLPRRLLLHQQVGKELERLASESAGAHLSELAHHFYQAASLPDAVEKALEYTTRAAEWMSTCLAFEDAVVQYQRALQLIELQPTPDRSARCKLLLALGTAQGRAGEHATARETFLRAAAAARAIGSPADLARAALRFDIESVVVEPLESGTLGAVDETFVALLEEALASLADEDSSLRAKLLGRIAVALHWSPQSLERREALSRAAVEMAERLADPDALAAALNSRCYALWGPDSLAERLAVTRRMLEIAESAGRRQDALAARLWILLTSLELADVRSLDRQLEEIDALARELRQPFFLWYATLARGMRLLMQGKLGEGEAVAQQALAIGQRAGHTMAATLWGGQMFRVWADRGMLPELEAGMAAMLGPTGALPAARAGLAFVYGEVGKLDAARSEFEILAADDFSRIPRDVSWIFAITNLAEVCATLGDKRRAAVLQRLLSPFAGQLIVVSPPPIACWGPVSHYLGLLSATLDRRDEAEAYFRAAIATSVAAGAPPFAAHAQYEWARLLADKGSPEDRPAAASLLGKALETARDLEMSGLVRKAEALAARLAERETTAPQAGAAPDRFRKRGARWTITYQGVTIDLADAKGLSYIATLLGAPGSEVPAADLAEGFEAPREPAAGAQARRATRAPWTDDAPRLASLRSELEEAVRWGDVGRVAHVREEIHRVAAEIAAGYGLDAAGKAGSAAERTRKAVTGRIREAIKRIRDQHPTLGVHLDNAIHTGILCSYRPDRPTDWTF